MEVVRVARAVADAASVAADDTLTCELVLDELLGAAEAETRAVEVIAEVSDVVPELYGEFVEIELACAVDDVVRVAFEDFVLVAEELPLEDAAAEIDA